MEIQHGHFGSRSKKAFRRTLEAIKSRSGSSRNSIQDHRDPSSEQPKLSLTLILLGFLRESIPLILVAVHLRLASEVEDPSVHQEAQSLRWFVVVAADDVQHREHFAIGAESLVK